jgi:hypothetical protein
MNIKTESRRLMILIATVGISVAGALSFDCAWAQTGGPATMTLNAAVQLTKLHPLVKYVRVMCTAPMSSGVSRAGNSVMANVNMATRSFAGNMQTYLTLQPADLEVPANRTVTVTCRLQFQSSGGIAAFAVANATEPQTIASNNWYVVAAGSTVTWTQAVTFPNTAP